MAEDLSRKAFIFTAPRFKIDQNVLSKGHRKRKCFNWKISELQLDHHLAQKTTQTTSTSNILARTTTSQASINELQENSGINLDYELDQVRDSLLGYLEDTSTESSHEVETTQPFLPQMLPGDIKCPVDRGNKLNICRKTAQEEYNVAFEQSQKLLEESQGFNEMSLSNEILPTGNSMEIQVESEFFSASEGFSPNAQTTPSMFTKLSECRQPFSKVNIFAVVLQVNAVKEVQVKSGVNAGCYVKVSSVLVSDPSKEYFKLTFWRKAAHWVTSLIVGNIIVVKKLKIDQWNNEFYGQNTFETTLVNLGQATAVKIPLNWLMFVNKLEAKALVYWLKARHPYTSIEQKVTPCEEVKWQTLLQLKANSLIHYKAKIVKVLTYNNLKGSYSFGSKTANKVMALAIDPETSKEIPICLWGHQADWQYDLKTKIGQLWAFKFLRVECKTVYGDFVLHTTPRSSKSLVQQNVPYALPDVDQPCTTFPELSDLLKANFNGQASVTGVNIVSLMANNVLTINNTSDFKSIEQFFKNLIYLGCKSCLEPVKQDHNGIYIRCNSCRKSLSISHSFGVIYCYKQCQVQISDPSATIIATSSHNSTANLLKGFDIQDVLEGTVDYELYGYLSKVFSGECKAKVTIYYKTELDENGFVKRQDFGLIDLEMQDK